VVVVLAVVVDNINQPGHKFDSEIVAKGTGGIF
jgi:hypothetical protein